MSEAERLRAQGLDVTTVGEILDGRDEPIGPMKLPVIDGYPVEFPKPGIYFGMSNDHYQQIPALSASGIKRMAASPMMFWADAPWLNEECAEERKEAEKDKDHLPIGQAYHARLLEGPEAYAAAFVVRPDKPDFGPDLLVSTDEIKSEIERYGKPAATRVGTGEFIPDPRKAGAEKELSRAAKKEDWINQLLELDPDAKIYDRLMAEFEAEFESEHQGKIKLPAQIDRRIQIAAMMIERDPKIAPFMQGGQSEVVLCWYCPVTGVPMKAKVDKLQITRIIDLKTLANQRGRSIDQAIRWEISGWHLNLQPSVYFEGAQEVRKLVRASGADVVHVWDGEDRDCECADFMEKADWAIKWASHRKPDDWGWLFQQKGRAPITRLVWYPRGTTKSITDDIVARQKRRVREWSEHYGVEPWLDLAEPYTIADEDIPGAATEI